MRPTRVLPLSLHIPRFVHRGIVMKRWFGPLGSSQETSCTIMRNVCERATFGCDGQVPRISWCIYTVAYQLIISNTECMVLTADNHDIISMKMYQLMVEHTPEEDSQDWTKIEPSVSLLKSPKGTIEDFSYCCYSL